MADITMDPRDKIDLSITNRTKPDSLTWDTIGGTWDDHRTDTWDSPRRGLNNRAKIDLEITPRSKN